MATKRLFPIRGPHRQVFVCGVEVKATSHDVGDVKKGIESDLSDGPSLFENRIIQNLRGHTRQAHPGLLLA